MNIKKQYIFCSITCTVPLVENYTSTCGESPTIPHKISSYTVVLFIGIVKNSSHVPVLFSASGTEHAISYSKKNNAFLFIHYLHVRSSQLKHTCTCITRMNRLFSWQVLEKEDIVLATCM